MSEKIPVGNVNLNTGELLDATLAVIYPPRKNGFGKRWFAMAQDPLMSLAKADLGDEARRVLFALMALLDFDNLIALQQAELAECLNMRRPNINRAIAKLRKEGVILAGPRIARRATFRLNPTYGWKGSARAHNDALRERMKARGMTVIEGGSELPERDTKTGDLFDGDRPQAT